ncbi:hypothetical protein GCM10022227_05180 [Streptomyces sedi]
MGGADHDAQGDGEDQSGGGQQKREQPCPGAARRRLSPHARGLVVPHVARIDQSFTVVRSTVVGRALVRSTVVVPALAGGHTAG